MQVSVITKNNEFFELLSQYNNYNANLIFKKYSSVSDYYDETVINDILISGNDIEDKLKNNSSSINIGEDIKLPYKLNDLFATLESKVSAYRYVIQGFVFDSKGNALAGGAAEIDLTETESKILLALINESPNIIDKRKLLELVFGYSGDVDTHTLETHIYRLRKKIGSADDFIITDKTGYGISLKS